MGNKFHNNSYILHLLAKQFDCRLNQENKWIVVASMHCIVTENHEVLHSFDDECLKWLVIRQVFAKWLNHIWKMVKVL